MDIRWQIDDPNKEQQQTCLLLEESFSVSPVIAWLLVKRGIRSVVEAENYMRPTEEQLFDPYLMKDMDKAVNRLYKAINSDENVLIYGDYDVDGVTSVALMIYFFRILKKKCFFYIPNRNSEGYGLSIKGIDYAKTNKCSLLISMDCGIKDIEAVAYAKRCNIETIICDHHTPGQELPEAVATLDIKRGDCPYPYKDLSGCGVGFKLIQAYCQNVGIDFSFLVPSLQLVALSIACDIVSMTGENRVLETFGLEMMRTRPFMGLKALMEVANINVQYMDVEDIAFRIGPRINASGRLHSAVDALRLLITEDIQEARQLAQKLNKYNEARQTEERRIEKEALEILNGDSDNNKRSASIVFSPTWHRGVIGITASALTRYYYRPTIVLTQDVDGNIVGSARSVGEINLYQAIDANKQWIIRYGGHAFAAGLTLDPTKLETFKQGFYEYISSHYTQEDMIPLLHIDSHLSFEDIDEELISTISQLGPFGPNNPRPLFVTHKLQDGGYSRSVGKNNEHLKLHVRDSKGQYANGIAFGKGNWIEYVKSGKPFSLCYHLGLNTFNGITSVQLSVVDIKKDY